VSDQDGLVRPDPAILTPNDLKRCKVALNGQSPHELLAEPETMFQVIILALALRTDAGFTYEQAGDEALGSWFDMSAEQPPPPPTSSPASPGSTPSKGGGSSSRKKPTASGPALSSAGSTASPATSTTP
jgi:hypothetical protein